MTIGAMIGARITTAGVRSRTIPTSSSITHVMASTAYGLVDTPLVAATRSWGTCAVVSRKATDVARASRNSTMPVSRPVRIRIGQRSRGVISR